MTHRVLAGLALFTALAATSTTLAAPTHAQKWTHSDPAGDVMRTTDEEMEPLAVPEPAPTHTKIDATRVVAKHTRRSVIIKVRARGPVSGPLFVFSRIKTPRKDLSLISMRIPGAMSSTDLLDFSRSGKNPEVRCRGLKRTVSADKLVITLTVPRACIGRPRWVRFSLGLGVLDRQGRSFDDDALRSGLSRWGAKLSPRIRRG